MSRTAVPSLATLLVASLSATAGAQLSTPGEPLSGVLGLDDHLPLSVLPQPDLARYRAEDAAQAESGEIAAYRYGAVVETTLDIDHHGRWDERGGALVWRAEVASPGAYSLGILFDEYDLPAGAQLFVYAPDRSQVLGAFTEATEQPNGMLAVQPLRGDRAILEYVQPAGVVGVPRLSVESVVHDYRNVLDQTGSSLERASCLIDVNCPAGQPYQVVKQAVVALFRGGFTCTGTILNNTAEDGTPYMLTAQHCGGFTNGTFVFNYERPACGSGGTSLNDSLSGAQLLAFSNYIDAQLYVLNQAPPESYDPFYAGWGRSSNPPKPVLGISHPAGLPRKISIDNDRPVDGGKNWVVTWDQGEIQGGSSGSALLNASARVIGSLTAGSGSCGGQTVSYGQFRKFFSSENLAQWLDPIGSGTAFLDGFDPFEASAVSYNGGGTNADVYVSQTVPALGTSWDATVDVSGHAGATSTVIDGYGAASAGLVFGFGELLVDLGSPRYFRSSAGVSGGLSSHSNLIPNDPSFQGAVAHTQAFILGGGLEATNGVRLRVY